MRTKMTLLLITASMLICISRDTRAEESQLSASDITQCQTVLKFTGREKLNYFDRDTRFAYASSRYCRDTSHNYDGKFWYGVVGLEHSYKDRDEQCREKLKVTEAQQARFLEIDSVVERSVAAWENCIKLRSLGIRVEANLASPTRLTLALSRAGGTQGEILGVTALASACKTHFKNGNASIEYRKIQEADPVSLPLDGALTILCDRDPAEPDAKEGIFFPESVVTIITSEGPFSYALPEEYILPKNWSSTFQQHLDRIDSLLSKVSFLPAEPLYTREKKGLNAPLGPHTLCAVAYANASHDDGCGCRVSQQDGKWNLHLSKEAADNGCACQAVCLN